MVYVEDPPSPENSVNMSALADLSIDQFHVRVKDVSAVLLHTEIGEGFRPC
jgi:hypothetical protein